MSSSVTSHEATTMPEAAELDSDGSSCSERDPRKRVRGDTDPAGPKKRRKQTTPVRLSSGLASGGHEDEREDEHEDEDSEGKPSSSRSPLPSNDHHHHDQYHDHHHHHHHHHHHEQQPPQHQHAPSSKDENLNNEFRCQHCGRFFDSKETLNVHVNGEHGVAIKLEPAQQLDQTEGPVSLLSVKNFATSTTWLTSSGQHVQSQAQMQSQMQGEDSWPGSVNQIATMTNHLQALSGFPGALAQYLPLPGFPLTDPQQVPRSSLGPAPIRIFNPDAYCDLCNKEFCNKYFLKTHKANKHGIYVDSPATSSSAMDANVSGVVFGANFHGSAATVKLEPPATPPTTGVACDVCQKRFRNEESARKHRQKVHNETIDQSDQQMSLSQSEDDRETPRDSPGGMEALFKQEYGVEQEDTSFMPAPRHLSPQSIQQARDSGFNADRLRRLGVINPEAFCEICCKEYCNKYFLRTHKMKRHGIIVQDNERSPGNPGAAATWHQVQTSPLNLIVTESAASSESNDRTGEDHECKPCGIRFQTAGLYQAHCKKLHEAEERGSPKQEYDPDSSDPRTDSISEDLQKLQTMILQLNGLDSGKGTSCAVCAKECDSRSALRVHMATEHGTTSDDVSSSPQEKSPMAISAIFCTLCEKDYPSQEALRRHINEEHQPVASRVVALPALPTVVASTTNSTPTSQTLTGQTTMTTTTTTTVTMTERKVTSLTPTSSYCEICNKELCNKYFMKTHMQRMHGIEIENGAQIGGVICNICNKELCSKYFLRVHKHNTHGIVDENISGSTNRQESYDASGTDDSALKPEQLGDLSNRYFTHFTEVCPICNRRFRSVKWLKAHLMGDHGKAGIDKWRELEQQYQATPRSSGRGVASAKTIHQSSNLKIPNGFEVTQQIKSADYTNLGNQVLSNLFGASSEEQLKNYRCSFCNFTTPVLPFLFLHERSHVNPQESLEGDRALQCPICSQDFHQPELLHQHLLTKHQFPTLLSQFQQPMLNNFRPDVEKLSDAKDRGDPDAKDDRAGCSPQTADQSVSETSPSVAARSQRQDETAVQVTPQGAYKCAQCGYATTNLNRIKKHVRKDHKAIGDPTESVIAELSKTLKEVANKQKVPACYAMPQDLNSNPDKTIMQPFLIEEQDLMQAGAESSSAKRFAPALVYLPVKSRINNVLTASFTLTPA